MDYPRVLLVDDDTMVTRALVRILAMHCLLEINLASSPKQALEYLDQRPYAVLVSDFSLPGISGPSLFKIAEARWPEMKRVLFTGHARESLMATDLELVDAFLEKGMGAANVARTICRLAGALHE